MDVHYLLLGKLGHQDYASGLHEDAYQIDEYEPNTSGVALNYIRAL